MNILDKNIKEIMDTMPYAADFFESQGISIEDTDKSFRELIDDISEDRLEDLGLSAEQLAENFTEFADSLMEMADEEEQEVKSLTIIGGKNKLGEDENVEITISKGDIICIVGPTGSGKSRLLADIEWVAQKDTPTMRTILINGEVPESKWRFSTEHKLVAQLSQNMNFVMDLSAEEFVRMHAESRLAENVDEKVQRILDKANELAGEQFTPDTPVTSLSGGQSRALMIADTAILSKSPIVLIDEIENAGIDRKKALQLLIGEEKIVLMATHDPILALMGDRRLVIKNGGIQKIIESSESERSQLSYLEELDRKLLELRNKIRLGEKLTDIREA